MSTCARVVIGSVMAALLLLSGCQRVNQQKTVTLGPREVVAPFIVDAPSMSQSVTLTVNPNGTPIDAYIVLDKDRDAAMKAMESGQAPPSSLAAKQKVDAQTTLTATVPARSAYAVLVGNSNKEAKVDVKLTAK